MNARAARCVARVLSIALLPLVTLVHAQTAAYSASTAALPEQQITVGIEGKLDVLLPGPELKAKPTDRASPLILRVASTRPHGTFMQYDLRYIGLVPGAYDLRAFLVRNGAPAGEELPPLNVQVSGLLPPQHQGALVPHSKSRIPALGGYKWVLSGAAALWLLAAVPVFIRRRRRRDTPLAPNSAAPPTLAERLRPMVELASVGQLTTDQQAELERLLLSHWQQRLGLESMEPSEAMACLRANPEAGALLRGLEDWLHRRPGFAKVDVEAVLAPYRHVVTNGAVSNEAQPSSAVGG